MRLSTLLKVYYNVMFIIIKRKHKMSCSRGNKIEDCWEPFSRFSVGVENHLTPLR